MTTDSVSAIVPSKSKIMVGIRVSQENAVKDCCELEFLNFLVEKLNLLHVSNMPRIAKNNH